MKKMILMAAAFVAFTSCSKDAMSPEQQQEPLATSVRPSGQENTNAIIEWSGSPAADGLGWVLHTMDGRIEVPDNLPDEFKQDGLAVVTQYDRTATRVPCRCAEPKYYVHLTMIEPAKKE